MTESHRGNRLLTAGLIGSAVAVICCFTPALVILLSALGFAGVIGYIDYALLPAMAMFLGLIAYGWWTNLRCAAQSKEEEKGSEPFR